MRRRASDLFSVTGVQHSDFEHSCLAHPWFEFLSVAGCFVGGLTGKGVTSGYAVALSPSSRFPDAESPADDSSVLRFHQSAETNLDRNTALLNVTAVDEVFGYQCRPLSRTSSTFPQPVSLTVRHCPDRSAANGTRYGRMPSLQQPALFTYMSRS